MALASPLATAVRIESNIVSVNIDADATINVYDSCLTLGGSGIVSNNTFQGCDGNDGYVDIMSVTDGSSIIVNNIFIRNATTDIDAYILCTSSDDQVIIGNIFNFNTLDGSNTDLVPGLPGGSIYDNNFNQ